MPSSDDLTDVDVDWSQFVTHEALDRRMKAVESEMVAEFTKSLEELSEWYAKLADFEGMTVPAQVVEILETIIKLAERQADDIKELKAQVVYNGQLFNDFAQKYPGNIEGASTAVDAFRKNAVNLVKSVDKLQTDGSITRLLSENALGKAAKATADLVEFRKTRPPRSSTAPEDSVVQAGAP